MENKIKEAIESYQCVGCISGSNITCYSKSNTGGIGCGKHMSGTIISGIGKIFLGLPKGFNRLGENKKLIPSIFTSYNESDWKFDMWNIPTWKHLNEQGHTIVRGYMPRRNEGFIHIFLEDCINKIDCLEISLEDIKNMD